MAELTPGVQVDSDSLLGRLGLGSALGSTPARNNAPGNVLESIKRRARMMVRDYPRFPSLLITKDSLNPQASKVDGG
jgi:hypothetical protein